MGDRQARPGSGTFLNASDRSRSCLWAGSARNWRAWFITFLSWRPRLGLTLWLSGKESACSAGATGDTGSIPGLGRSPGEGYGDPLQYSGLENPMDYTISCMNHVF